MTRDPKAAVRWWHALQPSDRYPGDRATLARLRRAATVSEAMQDPATISLFRQTGGGGPAELPTIAVLAAVLAHVRADEPGKSVARALGPDRDGRARMSPLRFRRLLEAQPGDEQLTAFRRMVALAGGALPVSDLARSLLDWDDDRRIRWTYAYWDAGQPLHSSPSTVAEEAVP